MKFLSFGIIFFSMWGMCLADKHSPTNYYDLLQNLLEPLKNESVFLSEEEGRNPFDVTKAREHLEQMEQFCNIINHNIYVSTKCCADLKNVIVSFITGKYWALKMVDSLAKPPSGILMGNAFYPGDYKECKSISAKDTRSFTPKYCMAKIPIYIKIIQQDVDFSFGLCMPDSCNVTDIEHLFEEGLHMLPYHLGDKYNATVHCPKEILLDTKAIIAITVCCVLFIFIVFGTLSDVFFLQMATTEKLIIDSSHELPNDEIQGGSQENLLQPSTRVSDCLKKFLLCFSILKNIEKLMKTKLSDQSLPSIHGIRFISMTWIILGHTYFFGIGNVGNIMTLLDMTKRFTFQTVMMGIYSVDTFFLISGMLVAYGTLKVLTEKGKVNWLYFYIHRFYRLTPTYAVLLMFYVCLLRYFGSGPYWNEEGDTLVCSVAWWRSLFYSNNFVHDGGCMGWTWYLANDMQFYLISPLLVFLLYRLPKTGILVTMLLMCIQFVVSAILITRYKIKSPSGPEYMDLYMKPYYRIGPYLVGILLGYILHVTNCKKTLNRVFVAVMWLMSIAISLAVIYGLYKTDNGASLSQPVATIYWTLSHTVWAICVAWVIFACCSGYGGIVNQILCWKVFIPFSRLTYCAYLIHPMVMIAYYNNLLYPTIITDATEIYFYIGHLFISYGFAFLASMIIEAPLLKIETIFFRKKE